MSRLSRAIRRYFHPVQPGINIIGHGASLSRLKQIGFEPQIIYDVGAHRGGWSRETSTIFPAAEFFLFEANSDHIEELKATGHKYFISAIGSEDLQSKPFYLQKEGVSTGASFYVENTPFYDGQNLLTRLIPVSRLDTLVDRNAVPPPHLIKLDIQGAEIDVLSGAPNCLAHCDALITEVSLVTYNKDAPLFADVVSWITQRGFFCVDICEVHRWKHDCIFQIDLLFVKKSLFTKFCSLGW